MAEENKRMSRMYLDEEKKAKGGITPFPKIGYEDMTKMEDMSLDGVLENLRERYSHQLIYTYTSSILVAINPFKRLDIFDRNWVKYYKGKRIGLLSPHIFAIAEQAFNQMVETGKNQSVLVSGESGAGKTESTKLILQFLSARTDRESNIETMVLESVPVLESLGNAKTGRNDNSSRFGKFIEIQFDKEHYICGSKITPYLLEKSRIITQAKGERNYHIFYQLTEGMDDAEKAKYFLGRANDYKYLNTTGCIAIKGVDEKEELHALKRAMRIFEISDEIQENMFKIIASVLHLGNLEYRADGEVSAPSDAGSIKSLENAANLLGLDPGALTYALTHKKIQMRSEIINTPLTPQQSKDQTDALVKYLYSILFEWMVNKLNQCTYSEISSHFIGVLDIFGFELFEHNSFEQFLINYANESLQNFFNHHIFKLEQVEYEKEKIDWTAIDFVDNKPCLDLIEQRKPPGILCVLDEESKFPKATDETFITKLHQNFDKKNTYYEKPRLAKDRFIVKHYAGAVEYEIEGWRDKNKDQLPEHLIELVRESSNKFIAILYAPDGVLALRDGQSAPQAEKESKGDNKLTLGAQFKTQLVSLMEMLSATTPYFIRCVKPNMQKVADKFDSELIYNQLLYAGMLETIRIRRMGYPIRYPHDDFWKRFKCICPEVAFSKGDVQGSVSNLLRALGLNSPKDYQLGVTKVFLKQDISNQLEDRRNVALTATIIRMQTWWRLMAWHSQFVEQMNNSVVLQMFWRMGTKRTKFVKQRKAAKNIQLWLRMTRARKMMIALREKKRKEEEERKRKEEEERQRKIKEMGREAVEKEEEEKRIADAAKEAEEMEKFKALAEGEFGAVKADSEDQEEREEIKSENIINEDEDRRDSKLAADPRTRNSIMMKTGDKLEVPIDVDGRITLGLGWKGGQWDMDASCLLFRYKEHRDDVYYYNPKSKDGAITHKGGFAGTVRNNQVEGDAEQIDCTLSKISPKTTTLLFVVTVFSPEGNFSSVRDAYVRIIDPATQNEFCRYTLNQSGEETARIMCKLYRYGFTQWRIQALGEPAEGRLYKHMIPKVEPFLDSKPPKRKFRIRIHRGKFVDSKAKSKSKSATTLNSFCEIRYDIDKSKTKVVKKSLNPQWRSTKEVSGNSGVLEICVLHKARFAKEVTRRLDWRGATSTSVLLGIVVVPLTADNVQIQESWFPIEHKGDAKSKSKITGEIKLTIQEMLI